MSPLPATLSLFPTHRCLGRVTLAALPTNFERQLVCYRHRLHGQLWDVRLGYTKTLRYLASGEQFLANMLINAWTLGVREFGLSRKWGFFRNAIVKKRS